MVSFYLSVPGYLHFSLGHLFFFFLHIYYPFGKVRAHLKPNSLNITIMICTCNSLQNTSLLMLCQTSCESFNASHSWGFPSLPVFSHSPSWISTIISVWCILLSAFIVFIISLIYSAIVPSTVFIIPLMYSALLCVYHFIEVFCWVPSIAFIILLSILFSSRITVWCFFNYFNLSVKFLW